MSVCFFICSFACVCVVFKHKHQETLFFTFDKKYSVIFI